jgi:hypothetical protein
LYATARVSSSRKQAWSASTAGVLSIARVSTGPASVPGARSAARAQVSDPTASWQTSNAEHHRRRLCGFGQFAWTITGKDERRF